MLSAYPRINSSYSEVLAFEDAPKSSQQPRTDEHLRLIRTAMRQLEAARTGGVESLRDSRRSTRRLRPKEFGHLERRVHLPVHGSWHTTARAASSQQALSDRRRIERICAAC